jgi:hypothetical protein
MKLWLANSLLCLLLACAGDVRAQDAAKQGRLPAPQLAPGLLLRYQLDIRSTHEASVTGAVENPQGGTQLTLRFGATLTLQTLEPQAGGAQVRATVEQVSVAIGGDTFDPSIAAIEERYRKLDGFSTVLSPGGAQRSATSATGPSTGAEPWLQALLARILDGAGGAPAASVSSEQPVDSAPLRGTVLRVHSTYLRDEPCGGQGQRAATGEASLAIEPCALILTHSTLAQTGSRRDQTPPSYRQRGLRTAGRWEGAGESLAYVAHRTGWVVSITESQTEQMDFTIRRAEGEVVHRQRGRIETQTNLLLQSVETRK